MRNQKKKKSEQRQKFNIVSLLNSNPPLVVKWKRNRQNKSKNFDTRALENTEDIKLSLSPQVWRHKWLPVIVTTKKTESHFFTRMGGIIGVNMTCEGNLIGMSSHSLAWRIHGYTSQEVQYYPKLNAKLCCYVTSADMNPYGEKSHSFYQIFKGYTIQKLEISTKR